MKKKIFHVITRLVLGGASKVVLNIMGGLRSEPYDMYLMTGRQDLNINMLKEAKKLAKKVIFVDTLVREIGIRKDILSFYKLLFLFERYQPDIVHLHTYKAGVIGAFAAKIAGISKIIFSPHGHIFQPMANIPGVPSDKFSMAILWWLTKLAQNCASKIIAVSQSDMLQQVKLGLGVNSKYSVIVNGVDTQFYSCQNFAPKEELKKRYGLANNYPVIVSIGRLASEKGHIYLLECIKLLLSEYPNIFLLIAGTGPEEENLRKIAQKEGIDEHVRFLGEVTDPRETLVCGDIYVQPSLYESQGISVIEAMAMGKPVIASDVGGLCDVVVNNYNGFLVKPADASQIAEAIIRIISDKNRYEMFCSNSRARACQFFSIESMIKQYQKLYAS